MTHCPSLNYKAFTEENFDSMAAEVMVTMDSEPIEERLLQEETHLYNECKMILLLCIATMFRPRLNVDTLQRRGI
jgi:hypothetical protein